MTTGALPLPLPASSDQGHVYLSPHLDDAALSCGGTIHRQTGLGSPVLVVTIFAGEPEFAADPALLSPFALVQHAYWGNPRRPVALRRAEDVAALTLLGARATHLDYLDAVYRCAPAGRWLYTDNVTLLGTIDPEDPVTPAGLGNALCDVLPPPGEATVHAPLAVGRHVDHLIVHGAARHLQTLGHQVVYYEDYPYAEVQGRVESALDAVGARGWAEEIVALDPADVAAKVSAVGYYRSQLGVLFYGAEAMPGHVWSFAATRGRHCLAERQWWPDA